MRTACALLFAGIAVGGMSLTDRAADAHVYNLRKNIEPVSSEPRYLIGVRGLGYRFDQ
jgi:DNA-binding response OmpR family regulator